MPFPEVMYRSRSLALPAAGPTDDPTLVRMVVSTDAPVRTTINVDGEDQEWDEILEHNPDSIDTSAMRAVLFHHDPMWILGSVRSSNIVDGALSVDTQIDPAATLPSNVNALKATRDGSLKGTSLKYSYRADDPEHATIDFEARCVRVHKWRAMEATLTAIPADTDPRAGVRTLTRSAQGNKAMSGTAIDDKTKPETKPEVQLDAAGVRSAVVAEAKAVAALAESHKLRSADFLGLTLADAKGKILDAIQERDAKGGGTPAGLVRSHITVGEEHHEKVGKKLEGAFLWNLGFRASDSKAGEHKFHDGTKLNDMQADNHMRGMHLSEMIRETMEGMGISTRSMRKEHLAKWALGKGHDLYAEGFRDAANTSTGYFTSFIFTNIIKKAVSVGFSMAADKVKYHKIVGRNYAPDYKQFAIGSLGVGNLQPTAENAAFAELAKAEGVYLDNVIMYGGTISLSEQAIVSDDTGRFMEALRQAGAIAQKTRDKRTFQVLMRGTSTSDGTATWSSPNITTGATIIATTNDQVVAARVNLSKTAAALMNKVVLDGNPSMAEGRFLVIPPTIGHTVATGLMGIAPGQQNRADFGYEVLMSAWLEFAGLTGNSTSIYYLIADPAFSTGLVLTTLMGSDEPRVEQFDPGAVAAFKWKIYDPFTVGMGSHLVSGTATIAGIQQGTT